VPSRTPAAISARRIGTNGELARGLREIDSLEAAVVRRIFRAYADGTSPLRIAQMLNGEGTPGRPTACGSRTVCEA
jgi:hypothetical protein